jgi:ferredoxin-nitrite reductase
MMRLKVPNGIVNSSQMRFFADCVSKYPEDVGVIDITTRQNIQMRGVTIETAPDIIDGLHARNLVSCRGGRGVVDRHNWNESIKC